MLRIDPDQNVQLLIPKDEMYKLYREIEEAFCELDKTSSGYSYSAVEMKKRFPRMVNLLKQC